MNRKLTGKSTNHWKLKNKNKRIKQTPKQRKPNQTKSE